MKLKFWVFDFADWITFVKVLSSFLRVNVISLLASISLWNSRAKLIDLVDLSNDKATSFLAKLVFLAIGFGVSGTGFCGVFAFAGGFWGSTFLGVSGFAAGGGGVCFEPLPLVLPLAFPLVLPLVLPFALALVLVSGLEGLG
ncbi:hypothetical protein [Mycoplasmopsis pulmonis]|uniref:hypothetical protein n=1 Tax=Mycoplasmopsis pulmonis TaxID=2107 RepID=UPI00059E5035|nr:hypothetical protein [Mycoplasmopsis pulmonis]